MITITPSLRNCRASSYARLACEVNAVMPTKSGRGIAA